MAQRSRFVTVRSALSLAVMMGLDIVFPKFRMVIDPSRWVQAVTRVLGPALE
jgi:hypothetical protein